MLGLSPRTVSIILLVIFAGFAGLQYGPAYVTHIQFKDFVAQETKFAASSRRSPEDLKKTIVEEAKNLEIELDPKEIQIERDGISFRLSFQYKLPIDLRLYKHSLNFTISESGETFERARD